MSSRGFTFASGNLRKLLALPKYLLSLVFSWFVPRAAERWVFGSGAGVGEGALALARQLRAEDPTAVVSWLVADEAEAEAARAEGFDPVLRSSRHGYWATLRAGQIIVTHGLGDANRFGVFGGRVIQLWHGAPLKRLHLDSPVTTEVRGPAPVRALLRRMYGVGANTVDLYVAGSPVSAARLRSAFRVQPGRVRVLGDPRDDIVARQAHDPEAAALARSRVTEIIGSPIPETSPLFIYAPTWRDGDPDPAIPTAEEAARISEVLDELDAHLVIRSHPLGVGAYRELLGARVHELGSDLVRDITPLLAAFDAVVTDYSSIALDFSLLGRPIVWFAPDLEHYLSTRGLYEPLEVTSHGRVDRSWEQVLARLGDYTTNRVARRSAEHNARELAARFHTYADGCSAQRVLAEIRRMALPAAELIEPGAVFFESFYGRQITCNPLALDREIASRFPDTPRYWSVTSEAQRVPDGATAVLVGGYDWFAARGAARLLVVNDWLRFGFRRRRGQTVLQTWHGTMLKHLALGRPGAGLRTRVAIRRESRRWSLMLSQNPHSSEQFRSSYAFKGEILETGYPRDDRLARAVVAGVEGDELNPVEVLRARAVLGVPAGRRVVVYAPTWRDHGDTVVDELDVARLADELGDEWTVVARGHTRTHEFGGYLGSERGVIDASRHPDVNDVLLAADVLVTDYSSLMFDASVARLPTLFFVPDLEAYRDRERGFTFDFEATAPGPLLDDRSQVVHCLETFAADGLRADWCRSHVAAAAAWRERFIPWEDGLAAARAVDALVERGALGA